MRDQFLAFVNAINDHDIERLYFLMSDDHRFIDAHGNEVAGRDKMKLGWKGYFQLFSDYKIEITETFERDDTIAAFGFASGTLSDSKDTQNHWRLPTAWKAIIKEGKIKLWQVYADTKIPFEILGRR